tara:strand:+ start:41768 stop:42352 length:585 start_codon:yes stop_codon:yes gene_type:complete
METVEQKYKLARNRLNLSLSFEKEQIDFIKKVYILISQTFKSQGKLYWCGNGGSAAMASHLSAELLGRFKISNRKPLSSISLSSEVALITAISNDFNFSDVFSRQLRGLANKHDLLLVMSASGKSQNIIRALEVAKEIGMISVAFLGNDGGLCKDISDFNLIINSEDTTTIQESHLFIGHLICDLVDRDYEKLK